LGSLRTMKKEVKETSPSIEYFSIPENSTKCRKLNYTSYTLEQLQAKKWKPFISLSCSCSNIMDEYYGWVKKYIEVPHKFTGEFSILEFFNPGFAYVLYQCVKCGNVFGIHVKQAEDLSVWDYKVQTKWYHEQFGDH